MPRKTDAPADPQPDTVRVVYRGPHGTLIDGPVTLIRDIATEIPTELFDRIRTLFPEHVIVPAPETDGGAGAPAVVDPPVTQPPIGEAAAPPADEPPLAAAVAGAAEEPEPTKE